LIYYIFFRSNIANVNLLDMLQHQISRVTPPRTAAKPQAILVRYRDNAAGTVATGHECKHRAPAGFDLDAIVAPT
jgi:hypothetical protein